MSCLTDEPDPPDQLRFACGRLRSRLEARA
jgi:hypothetical protein